MKKAIVLLLLLVGLSCGEVFAQDTLSVAPSKVALSLLEKLNYELTLTPQQKEEVYALLLERSEKFVQVKEKQSVKNLTKSSFQEVNQQAIDRLKQVLTPEQVKKLRILRQESQRQRGALREEDLYQTVQDIELDF